MRKERGVRTFTGIAKLGFIAFLTAFAASISNTIWSVYLDSFVNNTQIVGIIISFLTFIAFISYFFFIPLIEKSDKAKLYLYVIFLIGITYVFIAFSNSLALVIFFGTIFMILSSLRTTSFGILVKDFSKKSRLSENEGLIYTLLNSAWLIGPLIAGLLAVKYGNKEVFLLAALFMFASFFVFRVFHFKDFKVKKKIDKNIKKNFLSFFKNKDRNIAYTLAAGVTVWWSFIYTFIPLLIIRRGLSEEWIGYFLFAIALPLISLEYPLSKITERKGFKKMFIPAYLLTGIFSLIAFFFYSNIYIVLFLLVLASMGMSVLEPTTESYFLDIIKGKDLYRFYGPYNTSVDIGYIFGNMSAVILLVFLPIEYLFIMFSAWMFLLALLSIKTKNIIERK